MKHGSNAENATTFSDLCMSTRSQRTGISYHICSGDCTSGLGVPAERVLMLASIPTNQRLLRRSLRKKPLRHSRMSTLGGWARFYPSKELATLPSPEILRDLLYRDLWHMIFKSWSLDRLAGCRIATGSLVRGSAFPDGLSFALILAYAPPHTLQ